jgi:hypothetical protein
MSNQEILAAAKNDPYLDWVSAETDICDAVRYRVATKHQIGEAPQEEMDYRFDGEGGDACGALVFPDGSLYAYSSATPQVWASAVDAASEWAGRMDLDHCATDAEEEFFERYLPGFGDE